MFYIDLVLILMLCALMCNKLFHFLSTNSSFLFGYLPNALLLHTMKSSSKIADILHRRPSSPQRKTSFRTSTSIILRLTNSIDKQKLKKKEREKNRFVCDCYANKTSNETIYSLSIYNKLLLFCLTSKNAPF